MSRRKVYSPVDRHVDGQRSSIGDFYVDDAVKRLDKCALIEMNTLVPATFGRHKLTSMLFPDTAVEKLEAVRGMVDTRRDVVDYPVAKNVLSIDWEGAKMPAPEVSVMQVHNVRAMPLFAAIMSMSLIRDKYAGVTAMLRWLNRNATPAAVRALWPAVLVLCPNSPMVKEYATMPSRWVAPNDAGKFAALMRDTAGTVAAMQLLPSDLEPRAKINAWLTFPRGDVTREDITFAADQLTVNL